MSFNNNSSFTAIDFEAANGKYTSICQVGLVRVEHGIITDELDLLIRPPQNDYHWGNSRVHGIYPKDTVNAPAFSKIWHRMERFIAGQKIVAHNASYDCKCLKQTLAYYNLPIPEFESHCTVKIYKKNLADLCKLHNIELQHHNALSDARACAQLYLKHLETNSHTAMSEI